MIIQYSIVQVIHLEYASWLNMWLCYSKYAIEVIQMLNFTGTDSRRRKLQELKI